MGNPVVGYESLEQLITLYMSSSSLRLDRGKIRWCNFLQFRRSQASDQQIFHVWHGFYLSHWVLGVDERYRSRMETLCMKCGLDFVLIHKDEIYDRH